MICPHANRPGAEENVKKNFVLMRAGKAGTGTEFKKPKWETMGAKAKRSFAKTLVASTDGKSDFKKYIKEVQEEEDKKPAAKKPATGTITLFPTLFALNATAQAPPLPVKLDGNLAHCAIAAGGGKNDNIPMWLMALIDLGAGATIGFQGYFEGAIFANPSILEGVFTCKDGKYSPITP